MNTDHRVSECWAAHPCPRLRLHGNRKPHLASEHVVHLRHVVQQLVRAHAEKAHNLDVDQGPEAGGGTHSGTNEAGLGYGGIPNALRPEFLDEALCHTERTAEMIDEPLVGPARCASDVLAHHDHARVFAHHRSYGLVHSLDK